MSKTNSVRLIGNVGNKPDLITTNSNSVIVKLTMATHETFKDKDGNKQKKTEWHNVLAFGKLAELSLKYVDKGDLIMVEGKLQTRQYEDKQGNNRYVTEIIMEEILFLTNKNQANP
jgi:single-strand DNA-binding protein